jgi:small conductance mechanosensitive channel
MEISFTKVINILLEKLEDWLEGLAASFPNFIVAILIVTAFWVLARLTRSVVSRLLLRFADNAPVANLVAGIAQTTIVMGGFFIALGILNLDKTVTSLLAGAGVVGLAIGFAFQEIASNFIAGILIAFRKPFKIGDIVKVNDYEGRIQDIDLRTTRISTYDGLEVIIPNKDMFTSSVVNYTATAERRVDIEIGVSYGEDLRRVRSLTLKALEDVTGRVPAREPEVFFTTFGDSSINFKARVWIDKSDPVSYLTSLNDIVIRVKEAYDQNDIMIPFPIRTLDFGIKGGEKLSEMLNHSSIEEKD